MLEVLAAVGVIFAGAAALGGAAAIFRGNKVKTDLEILGLANHELREDNKRLRSDLDNAKGQLDMLTGTLASNLARSFAEEMRALIVELRGDR